jgi:hypothetical protein
VGGRDELLDDAWLVAVELVVERGDRRAECVLALLRGGVHGLGAPGDDLVHDRDDGGEEDLPLVLQPPVLLEDGVDRAGLEHLLERQPKRGRQRRLQREALQDHLAQRRRRDLAFHARVGTPSGAPAQGSPSREHEKTSASHALRRVDSSCLMTTTRSTHLERDRSYQGSVLSAAQA